MRIEHPLGAAQRLADALALITETVDEPEASAMNEIIHMVKAHLRDIDKNIRISLPVSPSQS